MENKDKLINSSYQSDETIMMFQPDYNDIMISTNNQININIDDLNNSDDLSEFLEYKDSDLESDCELESELDSELDFNFDFDIIYEPSIAIDNNDKTTHFIEIKSKIINKIKLNVFDLLYIKKLDDDDKFELIKIFNHMM
jgi:hypothetical protein